MLPADLEATMAPYGSAEFAAALPEALCLVGSGDGRLDDAFYRSAPKLRLVQLLSAGYDTIDIEAARRAGVAVSNNGGANSTAVSEATLLLMLAVARRLPMQHGGTAAGRWRGNTASGTEFFPHDPHEIAGQQRDARALDRHVRAAAHGDADIGGGQRRRVIDAVADHGDAAALVAQPEHHLALALREDSRLDLVDTERCRHRPRRVRLSPVSITMRSPSCRSARSAAWADGFTGSAIAITPAAAPSIAT